MESHDSSNLRSFLQLGKQAPKLVAGLSLIPIVTLAVAHVSILWPIVIAAVQTGCTLMGVWLLRHHSRSVRGILAAMQLIGWPFALVVGESSWGIPYLKGTSAYYAAHWAFIVIPFLLGYVLITAYYVRSSNDLSEQYRTLSQHRSKGSITATDLGGILSFQGRTFSGLRRAGILVPITVPLVIALAIFIRTQVGLDPREFLAHVASMALSCWLMALMTSRLWLQRRHLGGDDLMVVG